VILAFKVQNEAADMRTVHIGVQADVYFDGADGAPFWTIGDGQGFIVYTNNRVLSIVTPSLTS
jgi:hypothetical protein